MSRLKSARKAGLVLIGGLVGILLIGFETSQVQATDLFLHGRGSDNNPSVLFLDNTAPASISPRFKDSPELKFSGGNPWKEMGTWKATPTGTFTALSDLRVWLGLKKNPDARTNFDLKAEYRKGYTKTVC